jgi:hypothetical protein
MKKIALAAVLAVAASSAFAGGYSEPMIEPEVIVEDTTSSSAGIVVPIVAVLLFAAVATCN